MTWIDRFIDEQSATEPEFKAEYEAPVGRIPRPDDLSLDA